MFDKMKQFMEMKKQADEIKRNLDALEVDVEEVRGIKIRITGSQNFRSLQIDPARLGPDQKDRLEADLLRSLNAAVKAAQKAAARKMASAMPGLTG